MRFLPALDEKVTGALQQLAPVTHLLEDLISKLQREEAKNQELLEKKEHYKLMMLQLQCKVSKLSNEMREVLQPPQEIIQDSTPDR